MTNNYSKSKEVDFGKIIAAYEGQIDNMANEIEAQHREIAKLKGDIANLRDECDTAEVLVEQGKSLITAQEKLIEAMRSYYVIN
jgi:uncharacterized coiled-coil DUF342 family protein